jgi:hypothetical protein
MLGMRASGGGASLRRDAKSSLTRGAAGVKASVPLVSCANP